MSVLNANPAHQRNAGRNAGSPEISAWPSAKRSPGAGGSIVGTAASTTAASEDLILAKQTTEFATTAAPEQTPTSVPSVPSELALTTALGLTPAPALRTYSRKRTPIPLPYHSQTTTYIGRDPVQHTCPRVYTAHMVGPHTLTPTLTLSPTLCPTPTLTLTLARHRQQRLQQDQRDEPRRPAGGPSRIPIVHRPVG